MNEKPDLIEVLVVEPGQYPRIEHIGSDLDSLQKAVGGNIELLCPYESYPAVIVCDEEGKINGKPLNRAVYDDNGLFHDIIAGTFFVCGDGGEDLISLPKDLQEIIEKFFHQPEAFLKMGSRIVPVRIDPYDPTAKKTTPAIGTER